MAAWRARWLDAAALACSSSASIRCAPIGSAATATRRRDAGARRPGRARAALRAGDDGGAADAAGAHLAPHRHVPGLPRRARQRRLLRRRLADHAGRGASRAAATAPAGSSARSCSIAAGGSRRGSTPTSTTSTCRSSTWPPGSTRPSGRAAKSSITRSRGWHEDREQPFFAWVHLYDPHTPYTAAGAVSLALSAARAHGAYDGEIAATDAQVGRLLDAPRAPPAGSTTRSSSSSATTASRWASTASSSTGSSSTTRPCRSR